MTKERELLSRALDYIDQYDSQGLEVYEEIEAFLAVEPSRKPMTDEELQNVANFIDPYLSARAAFKRGIRFAEKHHGIGGSDECKQ